MESAGGELDLTKSTDSMASSVESLELDLTKSTDSMGSSGDCSELVSKKSTDSMNSSGDCSELGSKKSTESMGSSGDCIELGSKKSTESMDSSGDGGGGEVDLKRLRLYDLFKDEWEESDYESSDEELYYDVDSIAASVDFKVDPHFYDDDANGYHEMRPDEQEEYYTRVFESDGFDVPYFPKALAIGIIVPVNLYADKYVNWEIYTCAEYALGQHNLEMEKNYKLHQIVKSNVRGCAGSVYYITFQAEDLDKDVQTQNVDQEAADQVPKNVGPSGGPIVEFEAEVFYRLPDEQRICKMEVINFRQKGSTATQMIKGCCG